MAEPEMDKKKTSSSVTLDCSLLTDYVSKLHLSPSPSPSAAKEQTLTFPVPDWSLLPEELLQLISTYLEKSFCFVGSIHARSVCTSWRSAFPFPSCLLRPSYSLPAYPRKSKELCTVEKIPLFLYRVQTQPQYFLGGINREEDHHTELQSPLQCSVKVNLPGSDPTVMNMLDCQILPLGHRYRIVGKDPDNLSKCVRYTGVAFLTLNEEEREFVVILNYSEFLLVLRSSKMRWVRFKRLSDASCHHLFTFKGLFFANFLNGETFVINPYSLEALPLRSPRDLNSSKYLVPYGDEELYLVEKIIPTTGVLSFPKLACRVSKLDLEKRIKWIVVSDLGDRALFIGELENVACSSKELPDGCGLSGNSILFTDWPGKVTYVYKYGVETGNPGDDLNLWRFSREYRVLLGNRSRNRSPPVVGFRVESGEP